MITVHNGSAEDFFYFSQRPAGGWSKEVSEYDKKQGRATGEGDNNDVDSEAEDKNKLAEADRRFR